MKITDDIIDELCRRAAELYPLKLKSINWSKVLSHFKPKQIPPKNIISSVKKKIDES